MKSRSKRTSPITGGCLCGAVRYRASVALSDVHYCHCRMCQRAFGNLFAVFGGVPKDALRFTCGSPKLYRSSPIARRGFCGKCGTPLLMEHVPDNGIVGISIGSLDHPERVRPEIHWGSESEVPWLKIADGLPHKRTMDDPAVVKAWRAAKAR